jgi:hypothetical protein
VSLRGLQQAHGVDLGVERIQIQQQVYPGICECCHAAIVISIGVGVVHADRVRSQARHQSGVTLALGGISERVLFGQLVRDS